ncbi:hypothetical protein F5Y12DRAFT_488303 [Xylaria sp. FL1777]|nr:hypothetical protein F5Y12DRAFT_488303 [Xylaria sp. FL1777]
MYGRPSSLLTLHASLIPKSRPKTPTPLHITHKFRVPLTSCTYYKNMIEDEWRYFSPSGAVTPGGPSTWHILDWDQRRIISVTMDEEQESEDVAVEHLKKHIDAIKPGIYEVHLSREGAIISISTDPQDDLTFCVYYPPLQQVPRPDHIKTVLRSKLRELDRLAPNVDLALYSPHPETASQPKKAVFKYYFLRQFLYRLWDEMNIWMRLPPHPNIVPFDRLVLDEVNGCVVGFTSLYIPGDTIDNNKRRVFKLKWLKQLTQVIDDLNLQYGIIHQDVAARNLLVDPNTDALMLFDFNYSSRLGDVGYSKDRDDIKGVTFTLYEIITRDYHFRKVPHEQQNPADLEGLNWIKHADVALDHEISEYRSVLNMWVKKRRAGRQMTIYTEAPRYIEWPAFPTPPETLLFADVYGPVLNEMRRDKEPNTFVNWERPPQRRTDLN